MSNDSNEAEVYGSNALMAALIVGTIILGLAFLAGASSVMGSTPTVQQTTVAAVDTAKLS